MIQLQVLWIHEAKPFVHTYVCTYIRMYVHMYVCTYVCTYCDTLAWLSEMPNRNHKYKTWYNTVWIVRVQ